jgi:DNA-3-methyladenine glycosylase I
LRKRENYYAAFDDFDPVKMAAYDEAKMAELLNNSGIVRNRLKVRAFSKNAQAYLQMEEKGEPFGAFLWSFVEGVPVQNSWATLADVPTTTAVSIALSNALKKRGFSFVGPTIVYAFMQAVGMVNDHTTDCFRYERCRAL